MPRDLRTYLGERCLCFTGGPTDARPSAEPQGLELFPGVAVGVVTGGYGLVALQDRRGRLVFRQGSQVCPLFTRVEE